MEASPSFLHYLTRPQDDPCIVYHDQQPTNPLDVYHPHMTTPRASAPVQSMNPANIRGIRLPPLPFSHAPSPMFGPNQYSHMVPSMSMASMAVPVWQTEPHNALIGSLPTAYQPLAPCLPLPWATPPVQSHPLPPTASTYPFTNTDYGMDGAQSQLPPLSTLPTQYHPPAQTAMCVTSPLGTVPPRTFTQLPGPAQELDSIDDPAGEIDFSGGPISSPASLDELLFRAESQAPLAQAPVHDTFPSSFSFDPAPVEFHMFQYSEPQPQETSNQHWSPSTNFSAYGSASRPTSSTSAMSVSLSHVEARAPPQPFGTFCPRASPCHSPSDSGSERESPVPCNPTIYTIKEEPNESPRDDVPSPHSVTPEPLSPSPSPSPDSPVSNADTYARTSWISEATTLSTHEVLIPNRPPRSLSSAPSRDDESSDNDFVEPQSDDSDSEFVPNRRPPPRRQRTSTANPSRRSRPASTTRTAQLREKEYQRHDTRPLTLTRENFLAVYPSIPEQYPLFYQALLPGMAVNSDFVPKIGSVPVTFGPTTKCQLLKAWWHRGKRVIAQLDAFTRRCETMYHGVDGRLPQLMEPTRATVRDVRRKIVERCENYKYTRRDILNKVLGKNKWEPIEDGMVQWQAGDANTDPANDLSSLSGKATASATTYASSASPPGACRTPPAMSATLTAPSSTALNRGRESPSPAAHDGLERSLAASTHQHNQQTEPQRLTTSLMRLTTLTVTPRNGKSLVAVRDQRNRGGPISLLQPAPPRPGSDSDTQLERLRAPDVTNDVRVNSAVPGRVQEQHQPPILQAQQKHRLRLNLGPSLDALGELPARLHGTSTTTLALASPRNTTGGPSSRSFADDHDDLFGITSSAPSPSLLPQRPGSMLHSPPELLSSQQPDLTTVTTMKIHSKNKRGNSEPHSTSRPAAKRPSLRPAATMLPPPPGAEQTAGSGVPHPKIRLTLPAVTSPPPPKRRKRK